MADGGSLLTFDRQSRQLRLGNQVVELRPKEGDILQYLIERAGEVVSTMELQRAVWPGVKVGADALKTVMYALRKRIGDSSQRPQYIENVPRRGYRFIGPLHHLPSFPSSANRETASTDRSQYSTSSIVGRDVELATLSNLFTTALTGQRQVVFMTGEPGIGKTALVETFLQQLSVSAVPMVARGQCLELYGKREAYRPLLEAMSRLYQQHGGKERLALLQKHAPMVLTKLPALVSSTESQPRHQEVQGITQESMLREFVAVTEVLSHDQPVIVVIEDLHWSDPSTIDVLVALAQRNDPARLLVIGTYRPMDALRDSHPVHVAVQALIEQERCEELPVQFLSESDVASYLATRFAHSEMTPAALSSFVHQRTAGNPRFLSELVDSLSSQWSSLQTATPTELTQNLAQLPIPPTTTRLIEGQLRRLSATEQEVLLAASIVGHEFSAEAVAEGLKQDVVQVEATCEDLATRQQFIQRQGTRRIPERRRSTRYIFRHPLYCEVLALTVPAARYQQLRERIEQWKDKTR